MKKDQQLVQNVRASSPTALKLQSIVLPPITGSTPKCTHTTWLELFIGIMRWKMVYTRFYFLSRKLEEIEVYANIQVVVEMWIQCLVPNSNRNQVAILLPFYS